MSFLEMFEPQKKKNLRKYNNLVKTDFLRKSSNSNLIHFKKCNDIYGIISSIITYSIDYTSFLKSNNYFTRTQFNSFIENLDYNISKFNDFDTKLFRKFVINSINTDRDIYLITYLLVNSKSEQVQSIINHINHSKFKEDTSSELNLVFNTLNNEPKNLLEKRIHFLLTSMY